MRVLLGFPEGWDKGMYLIVTIGLMIVVPLASVVSDLTATTGAAGLFHLVGKWFTFWGIGVRLLTAGISQILRPGFTARGIFNIADPAAEPIVRELGFANLAIGLIGVLSLPFPGQFLTAAAVAGGLFLLLDGLQHLRNRDRSTNETIAMVTDLVVPIAVAVYLVGVLVMRG